MSKNKILIVVVWAALFSLQSYGMDSIISKKNQKRAVMYGSIVATMVGAISLLDQLHNEKYSWQQSVFTVSCLGVGFAGLAKRYFDLHSNISLFGCKRRFATGQQSWDEWHTSQYTNSTVRYKGNIEIRHGHIYMIIEGVYYPHVAGECTYENGQLKDENRELVDPIS